MLGSEIKSMRVRSVLVERAVDAAQEMYLGLIVDDGLRQPVRLACAEGGAARLEASSRRSAMPHPRQV